MIKLIVTHITKKFKEHAQSCCYLKNGETKAK